MPLQACTARLLGCFIPSNFALRTRILLALHASILRFAFTKNFRKKCVSIDSKCSETHRNKNNLNDPVRALRYAQSPSDEAQ